MSIENINRLKRIHTRYEHVYDPVDDIIMSAETNVIDDEQAVTAGNRDDTYIEYEVREILGMKFANAQYQYKVWWKGYPKSKAEWLPALQLNMPNLIKEYWSKHNLK